jgi:alpha-amylase
MEAAMGVIMQAFYWDCPAAEGLEQAWWGRIETEVAGLAAAGFSALWLPPANKAASVTSMGYDPYDYFDLGEFDQKGSVATRFGTRAALEQLIQAAHAAGLQVYADLVINHNSGADAEEVNPIDGQTRWTRFTPVSGKFLRNWQSFHPSRYETWDEMTFGGMPDLCHRDPDVYTALLGCAEWMMNEIGYDGFRYDFVKGYGGWMVRAIQEMRGLHGEASFKPFAVGECWDSTRTIDDWLAEVNAFSDNPAAAFDFPLRWNLQALCDQYGFSLRGLTADTVMAGQPALAVTFVENHDVARSAPIVHDKMLAYAVILTHPGYPCVFWQDYFNWGLGLTGDVSGIAALVAVHEQYAGGDMQVLYVDDDLYLMQRVGFASQPGLVFVLNNRGSWNGTAVQTKWSNTDFAPMAWRSASDPGQPQAKRTDPDGRSDFWAPPRGYAVYVPR